MLSQVFVSQKSFSEAFRQNSLGPHGKRGVGKHRRCWERKRGAAPQKKGSARRTAPHNQSTDSLYTVAEATGSHLTPRRSSLHRSFIYRHTRSKPSPGTGDVPLGVEVDTWLLGKAAPKKPKSQQHRAVFEFLFFFKLAVYLLSQGFFFPICFTHRVPSV